mgnify:FL=1
MSEFARLLEAHRRRLDLSTNEVARRIGVDPSYISRLIREERVPPRRPVVVRLCHALQLTVSEGQRLLIAAGYAPQGMADYIVRLEAELAQWRAWGAQMPGVVT